MMMAMDQYGRESDRPERDLRLPDPRVLALSSPDAVALALLPEITVQLEFVAWEALASLLEFFFLLWIGPRALS